MKYSYLCDILTHNPQLFIRYIASLGKHTLCFNNTIHTITPSLFRKVRPLLVEETPRKYLCWEGDRIYKWKR